MRFWGACLNIKSSVSDSQPHYSVVSLYHGIVRLYSDFYEQAKLHIKVILCYTMLKGDELNYG